VERIFEGIIEGIMQMLCGLFWAKPDQMPKVEYKDYFVVKRESVTALVALIASFIMAVVFVVASCFVDADTRILYFIFVGIALCIALLVLVATSYQCVVTNRTITKKFLFFRKVYRWEDISCVQKCEKTGESNVVIALYNRDGKCVVDALSEMDNAWYLVKMAENKGIEIRTGKDLSLKEINRLKK
jgi:hypothetical protein